LPDFAEYYFSVGKILNKKVYCTAELSKVADLGTGFYTGEGMVHALSGVSLKTGMKEDFTKYTV